ncbi:relaxase/mobilization nuclease domain-containing protein [Roseivivax marinus]|uniref:relaxase/mobilization nuclease domain-containing protein n=1 Tax=Roseivivax marinus TaxID=1379903 RepID=UPI000AB5295F|nr:relaxase/mobilization nuclease domain-containing protein [Roseivivax marinus]
MLIQFFPNGRGGGSGPIEYLTARTVLAYDENRDLIRDAEGKPETVVRNPLPDVLRGNADQMIDLIDACPHKLSYRAGVISFASQDAPSDEEQREIMDRFEELAFAGLDHDQYACLWVRHTHEERVELHFCTPRMELESGRSLNIAPPGYERAFDSLRDLANKQHGWADPLERSRQQEVQHVTEAPDRVAGRDELHGWILDQISMGLIEDRPGLLDRLQEVGFEVPRAGKQYITVKDPETDERWRLRGEIFHEEWRAEPSVERATDGGTGRDQEEPRRLDALTVGELEERYQQHCERRAVYNRERYQVIRDDAEAPAHAGSDARDAVPAALDTDGDGDLPDGGDGLRDGRREHGVEPEELPLLSPWDRGGQPSERDVPAAAEPSGAAEDLHHRGGKSTLHPHRGGMIDGDDGHGERAAWLRRAADESLAGLREGVARLRDTLERQDRAATGWLGRVRERALGLSDRLERSVGWLADRRDELRTGLEGLREKLGSSESRREAAEQSLKESDRGHTH